MRKIIYSTTIIILFLLVILSCSVQNSQNAGEVKFTFSQNTKSLQLTTKYSMENATYIQVSIDDAGGNPVYTDEKLQLYKMGEGYISAPLALKVGTYSLEKFVVFDSTDMGIFATPYEGTERAYLVTNPLPLEFSVSKDKITTVTPEVLDTEGTVPEDFGYSSFGIEEVQTFSFLVSVFIIGQNGLEFTEANITVSNGTETLYSGALGASTNTVEVRDGYTSYEILIEKVGYSSYNASFTNAELKEYFASPLEVVLE